MNTTPNIIKEAKKKIEDAMYGGWHNGEAIEQVLTTIYQRGREDLGEAVDEEITKVYRVLLEEFVYTGLATEKQWNESISPAFKRLTNVVNGLSPDSPTARVYKYPHESTFPNYKSHE